MKRENRIQRVAVMQFDAEETLRMQELNAVWIQTMDLKHQNILAYPIDIMVEKVEEYLPLKYINTEGYQPYTAEDGSQWLLSDTLSVEDVDKFFTAYFHLEGEEIAA